MCKAGAHPRLSDVTSPPENPNVSTELELIGPVGHVAVGPCQSPAADDTRWLWTVRLSLPSFPCEPEFV